MLCCEMDLYQLCCMIVHRVAGYVRFAISVAGEGLAFAMCVVRFVWVVPRVLLRKGIVILEGIGRCIQEWCLRPGGRGCGQ